MKKSLVCLLLFALFVLPIVLQAQKNKEVETRSFSHFSEVKMEGYLDVLLYPSDENKIRVESNKKVNWENLITEIRGNELHVYFINRPRNPPKLKIKLAFKELKALTLDGKVRILTQSPIVEDKLKVNIDGVVKGRLDVETHKLSVVVNGISKLALGGKSEYSSLKIDGIGRIDASDLITQYADTQVDGVAKTRVDVRKEYTASHAGIGAIHYKGNPKKKKISRDGISVVRKMN